MNICVTLKNISNEISNKVLYIRTELNSITLSGTSHSRFIPVSLYVTSPPTLLYPCIVIFST